VCRCGPSFCAGCYTQLGGAAAPCPTCKSLLGDLRNRGFERIRDKYQHQLKKKMRAAAAADAASLNSAECTLSVQATQQASGAETFGAASGTLCVVASPLALQGRASTSQDAGVDEGGLAFSAAHDFALPQAVSQDLEASAPERAASPSPSNAEHDPLHVASFPVPVHEAASGAVTGPLLSDALRSMAVGGGMQSPDVDHAATNLQQRALGGLGMSGVATAAEASRAEAGSAAPGALAVGQERHEGHVIWSSQGDEGNADDIAESTRQKKNRKATKQGGLTSTAAQHLALPQAGWQDLEAGAPERTASPSPLTSKHHPQHIASPPALVPVVHGVPYI